MRTNQAGAGLLEESESLLPTNLWVWTLHWYSDLALGGLGHTAAQTWLRAALR